MAVAPSAGRPAITTFVRGMNVKAASDNRTTITVERDVFKRERILWMDKDEPIAVASDKQVERGILSAIGKAL